MPSTVRAEEEIIGESLFDDDEVEAWKQKQTESESTEMEADPSEVGFDSKDRPLPKGLVFDDNGNLNEGGPSEPDIQFWHVAEVNGERFDEPTYGSAKLMELLEAGEAYEVKFAPPSFAQFKCTEKVDPINMVFEQYSHELPQELLDRAAQTLAAEGVFNTKQLGELEEKDYDGIMLPALIKTRLRKIRAEAKAQTATAENKVEMDGSEVDAELREYMEARNRTRGVEVDAAGKVEMKGEVQQKEGGAVAAEEEEDGTFKSLVWAIMNCPTCKGKETIACFRNCRYGSGFRDDEQKGTWSQCLDKCIENRWLRATFRVMLPAEAQS